MSDEPRFLTFSEVLILHADQLARYAGLDGVRDEGLLRSACAMPEATFDGEYLHKDLFEMAAAYAFHIAEGQCFIDGNKRTGLAAAVAFLDQNGIELNEPPELLAMLILTMAEHRDERQVPASCGAAQSRRRVGPPCGRAFSGIAKWGECGGPITVNNGKSSHTPIKVYLWRYGRPDSGTSRIS